MKGVLPKYVLCTALYTNMKMAECREREHESEHEHKCELNVYLNLKVNLNVPNMN